MTGRLRKLGIVLAIFGLVFTAGGAYAAFKVQEGYRSLDAFSAAQNVTLTYNEQGQLTSGGTTDEAQAIRTMLTNDWGYPVVAGDLNPNDPVVNTASEYMFQMATVAYHTLTGPRLSSSTRTTRPPTARSTPRAPSTRSRSPAATGPRSTAPARSTPPSVHRPGPAWPTR